MVGWLFFIYWCPTTCAQHPLTDKVIEQFQQHQDPYKAKLEMDPIIKTIEGKQPFTQYTRGYLYKECYKKNPSEDIKKNWRDLAVQDFQIAKSLNPDPSTLDNIIKAEKFIISTYYNDALIAARNFQESNEQYAYTLFERFEKSLLLTQIDQPVLALKNQFYKKLAERHYELWEKSDTLLTHPQACIRLYENVLQQDPTDCEALHNIAVLYYNIGVNKIKTISTQADIEALIQIQEVALELFRQALPYAQSTFQDCPKSISQYKALMYIQKSLGNDAEYERLELEVKQQFPNE